MRVDRLLPLPNMHSQFAWSHHVTVPDKPGCYALATYGGNLLYVGLATVSIRDRMGAHLDTSDKRKGGQLGVPFWFYYILQPPGEVTSIERGWMNQAVLEDGEIPPLNRIYSPL